MDFNTLPKIITFCLFIKKIKDKTLYNDKFFRKSPKSDEDISTMREKLIGYIENSSFLSLISNLIVLSKL